MSFWNTVDFPDKHVAVSKRCRTLCSTAKLEIEN